MIFKARPFPLHSFLQLYSINACRTQMRQAFFSYNESPFSPRRKGFDKAFLLAPQPSSSFSAVASLAQTVRHSVASASSSMEGKEGAMRRLLSRGSLP